MACVLQVSFSQVAVVNYMHLMGGMTTSCHVTSFLLLQSNTSDVWRIYQETDGVDKVSGCLLVLNTHKREIASVNHDS